MKHKRVAVFLVVFITMFYLFLNAGKFLVIHGKIHKSDAIVVLSGDRGERIEKAAELYHKGYGKYFVISGGHIYQHITSAQLMRDHAIALGVPKQAILLENRADSTYENAHFTKSVLKKNSIHSAIIVSSNYHMRRVKMIFDREYKNTKILLEYTSAKDPEFHESNWWSSNKSILITLNEYLKLFGYAVGKND
ncbi:MAG: YdcF family protein [Bacillota bacterium]|nr:YdcF family protein [Bacillota bacterium]